MPRPKKTGIDYFPHHCDVWDDMRVVDLLEDYGPKAYTVFMCIQTIIFSNGYYVECSVDCMARLVQKKLGNKHLTRQWVCEVITYLGEKRLLAADLLLREVFTSKEIQIHYSFTLSKCRRKLNKGKYWLLDDEDSSDMAKESFKKEDKESLLNAPQNTVDSEENRVSYAQNPKNGVDKYTKEKRNKKYIYSNVPLELADAFFAYVQVRIESGKNFNPEVDVPIILDILNNLSGDVMEQKQILNQSVLNRWINLYELKKRPIAGAKSQKKNAFHDFIQGDDVDYDAICPKTVQAVVDVS